MVSDSAQNLYPKAFKIHGIIHKHTTPTTSKTNRKAERLVQTSLRERAYATPYTHSDARCDAILPFMTAATNIARTLASRAKPQSQGFPATTYLDTTAKCGLPCIAHHSFRRRWHEAHPRSRAFITAFWLSTDCGHGTHLHLVCSNVTCLAYLFKEIMGTAHDYTPQLRRRLNIRFETVLNVQII